MKLPYKILLINIVLALVFSLMLGAAFGGADSFFAGYGLVGLFGGIIDLIIGFVMLFRPNKQQAQGFLLSAAFLMLTGFISCSTML